MVKGYTAAFQELHTFRLGFSSIPAEKIAPGIEKLAQFIDRMG